MKKTNILLASLAAAAIALVGCDWGGVSSEESWNDAYSWANFTGTYKLAQNVVIDPADGSGVAAVAGNKSFTLSKNETGYPLGVSDIVPGSVSVEAGTMAWNDDGAGKLNFQSDSSKNPASINYKTGAVTITLTENKADTPMKIHYKYYASGGSVAPTPSGSSDTINWLSLTQKGNLVTFKDNNGMVYSGRITGASCPQDSGTSGHIRFSFEATSTKNSSITLSGSISGDWNPPRLSNRVIDVSYNAGKNTYQIQAVSGEVILNSAVVGAN